MSSSSSSRGKCRQISYDAIKVGTDKFAERNVLGKGGEGKVYLANIKLGWMLTQVAVKQLSPNSTEFGKEIKTMSNIQHKNVVSLLGYCDEPGQRLLIYEYMENGSLANYVRKTRTTILPWLQRLCICLDAARGIHHLHVPTQQHGKGIVHRDIKPDNILLGKDWVAKVSDFGMFKVSQAGQEESAMATNLKGTCGYFAPEYNMHGQVTRKIDVYCFGIVLFQVLCLKMPWDRGNETYAMSEDEDLGLWAEQNVDPEIEADICDDSLKEYAGIIGKSLKQDPTKRPTMDDVVRQLEKAIKYQEIQEERAKKDRAAKVSDEHSWPSSVVTETIAEEDYNTTIVLDTGGGISKNNMKNLEVKVAELLSLKVDVEREVAAASRGSKDIGGNITWWKNEVSTIKDKSDILLKGADKASSGFLKGRLNVHQRFLLSRKAAQLNAHIDKLLAQGRKLIMLGHYSNPLGLLPASSLPTEYFPSRIDLMKQVMKALSNDEIYMIGICGVAGVGKTRLADQVKRRVLEEKSFEAAVKIDVSQVPDIHDIQLVVAHSLGLELNETNEDERARKLVSRVTDGSKNLIILDNIWDKVELHRVGLPLQGEEKGCKVLFTSQNPNLPRLMDAEKVEVLPLSTSEARLLFKKIAGKYEEDIADKVADECGGLPLAIDAVACALSNKSRDIWENALDQLREPTATKDFKIEELVSSRIKLSYDLLGSSEPEAQTLLLMMCCLFPAGADIPHQELVRYVMELKLLKSSDNLVITSNMVFKLLDDLKGHSLLLRGEEEMTVKMNPVVRDACLSISSDEDKKRFKVKHKLKLMQLPFAIAIAIAIVTLIISSLIVLSK